MKIVGMDVVKTQAELQDELSRGAKFVYFQYCISILVMTFRRPSDIYFVRAGESTVGKSMPFTMISVFLGWWGIPFGLIYTPMCIFTNLSGGKDVTASVLSSMNIAPPAAAAPGLAPRSGTPLRPS